MSQPEIRKCQSCGGSGRISSVDDVKEEWPSECQECGGTGEVWIYPKSRSTWGDAVSEAGWLAKEAKEFAGSSVKHSVEESDWLLPIYLLRWIFLRPNVPEPVKDLYIVGLLLLGPIVGYLVSVGPVMIFLLLFGGLEILRDPYIRVPLQIGSYGALFGGVCTLGAMLVATGQGRNSLFQALVIAVKIALLGGLFWSCGIFFVTLNPN